MEACDCDEPNGNTGTTSCKILMRDSEMLILMNKYGSDGTLNTIDLSDTLDQTYFDGKVNEADPLDRWYPLPRHKNPQSERGENVYVDYEDQTRDFVHQGVRPYEIILNKHEPKFLKRVQAWSCKDAVMFIVDKNKTLWGMDDVDGELRPIGIDANSFVANFIFPKASDVPSIRVSFNFDITEQDSNLMPLTAAEISPVNLLNLEGLLDVYPTYSSIGQTTFKAKLEFLYGTAMTKRILPGLVAGDFALYNVTDSASVTIVSCTESPDGTYTFTFASQTVSDKLRLTPTKEGYDFTEVVASQITVV